MTTKQIAYFMEGIEKIKLKYAEDPVTLNKILFSFKKYIESL